MNDIVKCKHCGYPIGSNSDCVYCEEMKWNACENGEDKGECIQAYGDRLQDWEID